MTKRCSKCKKQKAINNFGSCSNSKDGKSYYCFDCAKLIGREYRINFKYKQVFEKYNNKCKVCKTDKNIQVHHLNLKSKEKLKDLVLLCRNCHLKIYHGGNWKTKVKETSCLRCGHKWIPRKEDVRMCPKCKTPYFDTDKVKK